MATKQNTGHTPGPWITNTNIHPDDQVFDVGGKIVADCKWTSHIHEEREANARLISLAPELVEALREASNWIDSHSRDGSSANEESAYEIVVNIRTLLARVEAK